MLGKYLKKSIKKKIGMLGGLAEKYLNAKTLGGYGIVKKVALEYANNNFKDIGKYAKSVGHKYLSDGARNTISKVADVAIDYLPKGDVKNALKKINSVAQDKSDRSYNYKKGRADPTIKKYQYKHS